MNRWTIMEMSTSAEATKITDYIDVGRKIADLGCRRPERMALLPINFESASSMEELLQASEAATIRKLLLTGGIPLDDIFDRNQRPPYVKNKSHEWVAPIIFVSTTLYSQNPALVSLALNILGNYATDFFRGLRRVSDISLNIVVGQKNGSYRKITYQGPIEGLKDLAKVIREATK
jgi:hypothetical protein